MPGKQRKRRVAVAPRAGKKRPPENPIKRAMRRANRKLRGLK